MSRLFIDTGYSYKYWGEGDLSIAQVDRSMGKSRIYYQISLRSPVNNDEDARSPLYGDARTTSRRTSISCFAWPFTAAFVDI
jgi:hypothetical protein